MHTLVLSGELDDTSAHTLEAAIEQLCEQGIGGITLDLSELTYIDLTGVAVIAFRSRACRRQGRAFALVPGPWFVQRAFALAGLAESLPFVHERAGQQTATARERITTPGVSTPTRLSNQDRRSDRQLSIARGPAQGH